MKFVILGVVFWGGFLEGGGGWGGFFFWGGWFLGWFCGASGGGIPESFQVRSEQTFYSGMANYSELTVKNI